MSDPKPQPTPQQPRRRCRSLTVGGIQCLACAVRGEEFCVRHIRNRFPVCPTGPRTAVPLLEDLATIQVVATQVAHGLFTETLDPWRAGKILYALQVAAMTMPRLAPLRPSGEKPVINEPVSQAEPDLNGHFLGPDLPWKGNDEAFNPVWSYDRRRYVQECERLGKPFPATPQDFPAEGWLNREEMREFDPKKSWEMSDDFLNRILQMRLEEDRAGKLPPLHQRTCAYNGHTCKGPWDMGRRHKPCKWCLEERAARISTHREEDFDVISCPWELEPIHDPWGLNPRITEEARARYTLSADRLSALLLNHKSASSVSKSSAPNSSSPTTPPIDLQAASEPAIVRHRGPHSPVVERANTAIALIPKQSCHRPTQGVGGSGCIAESIPELHASGFIRQCRHRRRTRPFFGRRSCSARSLHFPAAPLDIGSVIGHNGAVAQDGKGVGEDACAVRRPCFALQLKT